MKVLSVSDQVEDIIYSSNLKRNFSNINLVLGCGDLPYYYIEYLVDGLNVPVFYVRGNHAQIVEISENAIRKSPQGAVDLHRKMVNFQDTLIMGFEGCLRYRNGPYQYSQLEMWWMVLKMVPKLWVNKLRYGRYLDILVSHSPPFGINDQPDLVHQGFKAFRWLIEKFSPRYHFHGHVHLLSSSEKRETIFQNTRVINSYGHYRTEIDGFQPIEGEGE